MISEISHMEKDKNSIISFACRIYKSQTREQRVDWCLPGTVGWEKFRDAGQRVPVIKQVSSGDLMHGMNHS